MHDAGDFRARLGSRPELWTSLALVVLAGVIVISSAIAERSDHKGEVMSAAQALTLVSVAIVGTWGRTILAFYYTKENYEAANRGTLDLVKSLAERLSATASLDKMMP